MQSANREKQFAKCSLLLVIWKGLSNHGRKSR